MGLSEVIDIRETQQPDGRGDLVRTFVVEFLTEETSGPKSIRIPANEFSPELARERASEEAKAIDQAVSPPAEE